MKWLSNFLPNEFFDAIEGKNKQIFSRCPEMLKNKNKNRSE